MKFRPVRLIFSVVAMVALAIPASSAAANPAAGSNETAATQESGGTTAPRVMEDDPSDTTISDPSESGTDFVAASCYGSARGYITDNFYSWPAAPGYAVTTSNCNDINVKPDYDVMVKACLYYSSEGVYKCNSFRNLYAGQWGVAATNVKDGTRFYLQFPEFRSSRGQVAY